MRSLTLIIAIAGAYALLRGWDGSPSLILRACLAVATLVAGLALWGVRRDSTQPRMSSLRKATWIDYLSLGAAVVFAEACFVVLTSTLAAPAHEIAGNFRSFISTSEGIGGNGGNGINGGSGIGGSGENGGNVTSDGHHSGHWKFSKQLDRQLPPNSNYKPSNKPEVFVVLDNAQDAAALLDTRIHLRSFAFSRFNGISWSALRKKKSQLRAPIIFPRPDTSAESGRGISHRIYHAVNPAGQDLFTALQGATTTDLPELTRITDSILMLPELENPGDGYSYSATSKPVDFTDLAGGPVAPAAARPEELDLPPELADRIRKTAASFSNAPALATRLLALRYFLEDNYTYSLKTTNPSGANPLENFLYREKRGYCEHFATAAAMLCRALGVPSRIAYGWSGGRLYESQNMFVFRAKDAHAWTEIKLEGHGWVVFDTTPPENDATPEAHTAPKGEAAPDPVQTIIDQQRATDQDDSSAWALGISPWILYSCLAVIGLSCLGFLITRSRKRPTMAPDGRPVDCPSPGYIVQFKRATAALGHPMPVGRTLRQHVTELVEHNAAPAFLHELLAYHYGTIYTNTPKNHSTEKHLNQAIRKWSQSAT